jgi:N-acetylglucosaminyl-diphospho-decaprenol L-rhamnosyltransferase
MKKGMVCAIVLDYRAAEKTQKCLLSLRNQGLRTVYVLDNSESEPHSAELRKLVNDTLAGEVDYRIEILSAGKNLGFAKGVNFVLSHDKASACPHEYHLLLNNDAMAGPALVPELLKALRENPQAALAAPRIVCSDPGREFGIWYHRYLGLLLSRPGRFRLHYLVGCCLLFRNDAMVDGRLFDEAFFMYGEDAELAWRLKRQGRQLICATNVFVEHEFGTSVNRTSFFYEYHMARSHLLLSLKTWIHPAEIPLLLFAKSFSLACRAALRSFRHRSVVPLAAYVAACFDWRRPDRTRRRRLATESDIYSRNKGS